MKLEEKINNQTDLSELLKGNYKIEVKINQDSVEISANEDGLITLANHFIALYNSENPRGTQYSLEENNPLVKGSSSLVIRKI